MEETTMLKLLDEIGLLVVRNRIIEAKRLVKQEINNLKDVTQKNVN